MKGSWRARCLAVKADCMADALPKSGCCRSITLTQRSFFPNTKSQDLARYYATFGGTPYYLARINESDGFEDNVLRLMFDNLLANGGVMIRLRGNGPILM